MLGRGRRVSRYVGGMPDPVTPGRSTRSKKVWLGLLFFAAVFGIATGPSYYRYMQASRIRALETKASGRVVSIVDNRSRRHDVSVTVVVDVEAPGRGTVRGEVTASVSPVSLPRLQPGSTIDVWIDPVDRPARPRRGPVGVASARWGCSRSSDSIAADGISARSVRSAGAWGGAPPPYHPGGYGPPGPPYGPHGPQKRTSSAWIVVAIIVAVLVVGAGGCIVCVGVAGVLGVATPSLTSEPESTPSGDGLERTEVAEKLEGALRGTNVPVASVRCPKPAPFQSTYTCELVTTQVDRANVIVTTAATSLSYDVPDVAFPDGAIRGDVPGDRREGQPRLRAPCLTGTLMKTVGADFTCPVMDGGARRGRSPSCPRQGGPREDDLRRFERAAGPTGDGKELGVPAPVRWTVSTSASTSVKMGPNSTFNTQ